MKQRVIDLKLPRTGFAVERERNTGGDYLVVWHYGEAEWINQRLLYQGGNTFLTYKYRYGI